MKIICFTLLLLLSTALRAQPDSAAYISGRLIADGSWERTVYLSKIPDFSGMYTMSRKMIVAESPLDSTGNFRFDLTSLPDDETLLRLHMVKRGNPATTLIIGGDEENHFFFLAHNRSRIGLQNLGKRGVFREVILTGSPNTTLFNTIKELWEYPNMLNYDSLLLEKRFVVKAVEEKLRFIADSCSHPLLSLYALYAGGFPDNYADHEAYYSAYLEKWKQNGSSYFNEFRKQCPAHKKSHLVLWVVLVLLLLLLPLFLKGWRQLQKRKSSPAFDSLSVQERKIFALLQEGATNQEISNACHIELSTVKSHVSSIFSKLHVKSRREIVNMKGETKE